MMIKVHFNAMHNYKLLENNVESLVFSLSNRRSNEWKLKMKLNIYTKLMT